MENPKPKPQQTEIEMNPPPPPAIAAPRFSFGFPDRHCQEDFDEVALFKSRPRRKRHDTWVISVFALLHIVAFVATMVGNDCWTNSDRRFSFKSIGRVSFQPLSENPLLGPSASTLDQMGALRRTFLKENHQTWRLFTSPWLHAGAIHLIINLGSVVLIGILLEQEFGSLRIGLIYVLSAFVGSLTTALFVRNIPAVTSSGALFGLLGAMLSGIIQNWKIYTNKLVALVLFFLVFAINFVLGLLPYVDNFANIGGFVSGFLLGFVLFFSPELQQVTQYEYEVKRSIFKLKLDRPFPRIVSLLLFVVILAGCLVAVLQGFNVIHSCRWCQYIDCITSQRWSCNDITASCETMASEAELTLTCMGNGNFRVFPFTNISQARMKDLCTLVCSENL